MADRQSARHSENTKQADRAPAPRLTAAAAGREALQQVAELTGKEAEGVSGVSPSDDGWTVTVDVVEDRRIPSTSDVLATYETELDADGELISYRRVRRYARGRGDDGTS